MCACRSVSDHARAVDGSAGARSAHAAAESGRRPHRPQRRRGGGTPVHPWTRPPPPQDRPSPRRHPPSHAGALQETDRPGPGHHRPAPPRQAYPVRQHRPLLHAYR